MRTLTISDPALLVRPGLVNFWPLDSSTSGWSGTAWTITSGWATAGGDPWGRPVMYRNAGLGTHLGYIEFEMWQTSTAADNWGMFAMNWGTDTNAYNDNGYSWVVRGPSSTVTPNQFVYVAGSGTTYTLPSAPSSEGAAITVGIECTGTKTTNVYVNRVQRASCTHTTDHSAKRNVAFGVHNGDTMRVRNVAVYTARPF